ncbi:hypothetical protein RF094_24505, partial [Serratia marcescens]|nr:hypothetical protein [Serratia marcescens]
PATGSGARCTRPASRRGCIDRTNFRRCCRSASASLTSASRAPEWTTRALKAGVDVAGFAAKIRRHRPRTIAFTSKKAASLFYRKPTGAIALGRQSEQDDFPTAFVLASPS